MSDPTVPPDPAAPVNRRMILAFACLAVLGLDETILFSVGFNGQDEAGKGDDVSFRIPHAPERDGE